MKCKIYIEKINYVAPANIYIKYNSLCEQLVKYFHICEDFEEILYDNKISFAIPLNYYSLFEKYRSIYDKYIQDNMILSYKTLNLESIKNLHFDDKLIILKYNINDTLLNYFIENNYFIFKENFGDYNSAIIIPYTFSAKKFALDYKNNKIVDNLLEIVNFVKEVIMH